MAEEVREEIPELRGIPVSNWKEWLERELTPPVKMNPVTTIMAQAFLELINKYELKK